MLNPFVWIFALIIALFSEIALCQSSRYPPSGGGAGSVSEVNTGTGLSGGPITSTGTVSLVTPVAAANGGTGSGPLTQGSVPFIGASGVYSENNSQFFWDASNARLGIGTSAPATALDVKGQFQVDTSGANAYLGVGAPPTANTAINVHDNTNYTYGLNVDIENTSSQGAGAYIAMAGAQGNYQGGLVVEMLGGSSTSMDAAQLVTDNNTTSRNLVLGHSTGGSSVHSVSLSVPSTTFTSYDLVLPAAQGGASTALVNDGTGGLSWSAVYPTIGNPVTGGTPGSLLFVDPSANLGQDNADLFWDSAHHHLGIGTSTPDVFSMVDVYAPTGVQLNLHNTTSTDYTQMRLTGTGRSYQIGVGNDAESAFGIPNKLFIFDAGAGGAMRLILDTSGDVGIGTVSPSARLDAQLTAPGSQVAAVQGFVADFASPTNPTIGVRGENDNGSGSLGAGVYAYSQGSSPTNYGVVAEIGDNSNYNLDLINSSGNGTVQLAMKIGASNSDSTTMWTLPIGNPAAGSFLQNNGSGVLSWVVPPTSGICDVVSSTITNTVSDLTCTGVPSSTNVALTCSPNAAFNPSTGNGLFCRATGTADQVECNTILANTAPTALHCAWTGN